MTLCRFYKQHSIKRKKITRYKTATPDKRLEYQQWKLESWIALKNAFDAKEKVIYVDEVVFTKATIPTLDYARRYSN